jgi:hypothetical protein
MRSLFRRPHIRPYLGLFLTMCFCTVVLAQTITPRPSPPSNHPHSRSKPASSGNPSIAVSPGNWSQLAKFNETKFYQLCCLEFGSSVAISGDTIVVSDADPNPLRTVAYVFVKPTGGWKNASPVAALTIPGTGSASDSSAAIAGDTIVLGGGYVYVKPAGGWTDMIPTATLSASDGTALGAVAISGNTIVATNPFANNYEGVAYVFVKPARGWKNMTQTAQLSASDGQPNDELGWSASISGGTIALGALPSNLPGKAYVFVEPSGGWSDETQIAELTASVADPGFGYSISTSGDEVLVGAFNFYTIGSAYMFVKPSGGWINTTETAKLSPVDPAQYSEYAYSVSVNGNSAAVGAPSRNAGMFYHEGGAYVFTEPAGGWQDMSSATVVTGSDARHDTSFGSAVALGDKSLVVGAPGIVFHAAYVFGLP